MNIQVFRFRDNIRLPLRGSEHAAGLDIYSPIDTVVYPGNMTVVATGLGFAIPEGWYGQLAGRSSVNIKGIHCMPGVIDADYRGEVKVALFNLNPRTNVPDSGFAIKMGDRIAQIMFIPCYTSPIEIVTLEDVNETERGQNGFGSTGR